MKCPKCGYLGFETTERCRNCQYDFSLAPHPSEPELTLHGDHRNTDIGGDFDLPTMARPNDRVSATALDLDRLFGDPEPGQATPTPQQRSGPSVEQADAAAPPVAAPFDAVIETRDSGPPIADEIAEAPLPVIEMAPEPEPGFDPVMEMAAVEIPPPVSDDFLVAQSADEGALPFDDAPLVPPPAARQPLSVRRSTPEVPRNRPRTTRPVRTLDFETSGEPKSSVTAEAATETMASLMESPSLGARVGAGLIDVLLLAGIDVAVVYLTLRVTGLQNTMDDLRVLSTVPFVGFLAIVAFGYVAAFTVAGGQTIGKMLLNLRVIGDDGRPVDAAGGMLRALGCMLVPITLGLSYLPALFTSDHRAVHDRLAGTRVVRE